MDIIGNCSKKYDSSLPWIWIVEYLSGFKEVDIFILKDLVAMLPDDLPDELTDKMKEIVALRCLEDLVDFAGEDDDGRVRLDRNKVEFDITEGCENVLERIMQNADSSMAGPEVLKFDVGTFVRRKREMRPKSALQMLKDMVLDDSSPLATSLKEKSGLMRPAECDRSNVDDVFRNAPTDGHELPGVSRTENVLPSKSAIIDLTSEDSESDSDECHKESDHLANSEKGKKDKFELSRHSSHTENVLPSKRNIVDLTSKDTARDTNECSKESNHLANSKKPKKDNFDELPGHSSRPENVLPSKRNIVKDSNSEKSKHLANSRKLKKDNSGAAHSLELFSVPPQADKLSKHDKQKSNFICSQLVGDASTSKGSIKPKVCMKCNKDGLLLFCSTNSCPLVLHEQCLGGSPANFYDNGKFYCPFCSQSLATSAYLEAKKKAFLARKELTAFLCMARMGNIVKGD